MPNGLRMSAGSKAAAAGAGTTAKGPPPGATAGITAGIGAGLTGARSAAARNKAIMGERDIEAKSKSGKICWLLAPALRAAASTSKGTIGFDRLAIRVHLFSGYYGLGGFRASTRAIIIIMLLSEPLSVPVPPNPVPAIERTGSIKFKALEFAEIVCAGAPPAGIAGMVNDGCTSAGRIANIINFWFRSLFVPSTPFFRSSASFLEAVESEATRELIVETPSATVFIFPSTRVNAASN